MRFSKVLQTAFIAASMGCAVLAHAGQPAPWEKGYEFKPNPNPANNHVRACLTNQPDDLCNAANYRVTEDGIQAAIAKACEPKRKLGFGEVPVARVRVGYAETHTVKYIDCP